MEHWISFGLVQQAGLGFFLASQAVPVLAALFVFVVTKPNEQEAPGAPFMYPIFRALKVYLCATVACVALFGSKAGFQLVVLAGLGLLFFFADAAMRL
jgi:hypothetical protein